MKFTRTILKTFRRQSKDFAAWTFWAKEHAPWTSISTTEIGELLKGLAGEPDADELRTKLDFGGRLAPPEALRIFRLSASVMSDKSRHVFQFAIDNGYAVLVSYGDPIGVSIHASEFLATQQGFYLYP